MVDQIVAPDDGQHNENDKKNPTLLYQNISLLANLFKLCYEDSANKPEEEKQAFTRTLRLLIQEHIEPICQKIPEWQAKYQTYQDQVAYYDKDDFQSHSFLLEVLALCMAHLVYCAIESFKSLNYPEGYTLFLHRLEQMFNNDTIIQNNQHRTVLILIEQLRQKPEK